MNSAHQKLLEGLIDKMIETTEQASRAIDKAITFVEETNKRIEAMEARAVSATHSSRDNTR